jgi:hypothetical protein
MIAQIFEIFYIVSSKTHSVGIFFVIKMNEYSLKVDGGDNVEPID